MNEILEKKLTENRRRLFINESKKKYSDVTIKGLLEVDESEVLWEQILFGLTETCKLLSYECTDTEVLYQDALQFLNDEINFINGIGTSIVVFHEQDESIGALEIKTPLNETNLKSIIGISDYISMGSLIITSSDGKVGLCVWCSEYEIEFYKWYE